MCLATSNNLLLVLQDAPKCNFSTNSRSFDQQNNNNNKKNLCIRFPRYCFAFATVVAVALLRNSSSIVIHIVKRRLLRNRSGSVLRPLATSCAKDYKAHSLQQTSFAESLNRLVSTMKEEGGNVRDSPTSISVLQPLTSTQQNDRRRRRDVQ